jgi:hypothetical protein
MPSPSTIAISARNARAVSDRLLGLSTLSIFTISQRADFRLAAKLLRTLLREYTDREVIEIEMGSEH